MLQSELKFIKKWRRHRQKTKGNQAKIAQFLLKNSYLPHRRVVCLLTTLQRRASNCGISITLNTIKNFLLHFFKNILQELLGTMPKMIV